MAFNWNLFLTDLTERAVSTGWQIALAISISTDVLHRPESTPAVAVILSAAKSGLVQFYQTHPKAQQFVKDVEPIIADVAPAVLAAKPLQPVEHTRHIK